MTARLRYNIFLNNWEFLLILLLNSHSATLTIYFSTIIRESFLRSSDSIMNAYIHWKTKFVPKDRYYNSCLGCESIDNNNNKRTRTRWSIALVKMALQSYIYWLLFPITSIMIVLSGCARRLGQQSTTEHVFLVVAMFIRVDSNWSL